MNNKELKLKYNRDFSNLRKIINSWNLIPESPIDEFDKLTNNILSQLYQNSLPENIEKILQHQLIDYYGIYTKKFNADKFVTDVLTWWNIKTLIDERTKDDKIFEGTTVNERLHLSNLFSLYDKYIIEDKSTAKYILEKLKVDNESIKKILKDCT